jgi:hypothetical protein
VKNPILGIYRGVIMNKQDFSEVELLEFSKALYDYTHSFYNEINEGQVALVTGERTQADEAHKIIIKDNAIMKDRVVNLRDNFKGKYNPYKKLVNMIMIWRNYIENCYQSGELTRKARANDLEMDQYLNGIRDLTEKRHSIAEGGTFYQENYKKELLKELGINLDDFYNKQ